MRSLRRDNVPAKQAKARCVVAQSVFGARTVRRCRRPMARCADLSRIARGKFQSCGASRQILGDRCDCSDPNRILTPLPAPGIAVSAASSLHRSCPDVPGPLELHFRGRPFLSCFLRSLRPGKVFAQRHGPPSRDSVFDVLRDARRRAYRSSFCQRRRFT
jgi:hypothetical protein